MKRIELIIFAMLSIILLGGIFTACNAQNTTSVALKPVTSKVVPVKQQKAQIRAVSLSELIGSTDEIECFAFYFDTKPEIIERDILDYRMVFIDDLQNAGYKPRFTVESNDYIHFHVPFDNSGNIISWADFIDPDKHEWDLKQPQIIGRHAEKTVFHYEID